MTNSPTQALRSLRWFGGLAVVVIGIIPAVMLTLLVTGGRTPASAGFLLLGGVPLVLAALVLVVRGIVGTDPEQAERRLHLGMTLVAGAALIMLGGNALMRMS